MLRGRYGKPYRPPPGGWASPRKVFLGGLYQHINNALNNVPALVNTTQVPLQTNQVGAPATRPYAGITGSGCEQQWDNGLPKVPWIGLGNNQYRPFQLGGTLTNQYTRQGINNLGLNARQRGFKNVQACRQWHSCFGWTSHDPGGFQDNICNFEVCDASGNSPTGQSLTNCANGGTWTPTYQTGTFESYQQNPDQVKYLTVSYSETYTETYGQAQMTGSVGGAVSVNPSSGMITSTLITNWELQDTSTTPPTIVQNLVGGVGPSYNELNQPIYVQYGATTPIDGPVGRDLHTAYQETSPGGSDLPTTISSWNATFPANPLPLLTDPNNYSATATNTSGSNTDTITLSWSRNATTCTWDFDYASNHTGDTPSFHYAGTRTLSNPNPASSVKADVVNLLKYWNLADDAQYPWRTDGVWQVAPLVSRDEVQSNISPIGFIPYTQADYRNPINDVNGNAPWTSSQNPPPAGWTYNPGNNDGAGNPPGSPGYGGAESWQPTYGGTTWFDPNAWGFTFPNGFDQSNATANGIAQYALTGLILGMPMPRATNDTQSYWGNPNVTLVIGGDYQNFFDFLAVITKACQDEGSIDVYNYGYGEWCYDAITRTGAQLPHRSTQWTPNNGAYNKPPYAYLIQGDKQTYDLDGSPGEGDFLAWRGDALWAQKCCEIQEIWPSQDFFQPAGNDRFAPDETAVYCISSWAGTTATLTTAPTSISVGNFVGVNNGGNVGIFAVAGVSNTLNTVTLGTQQYPLPTGFTLPSGDTATALWKVRYPTAPPIQGRDAIATLTASGSNTTITLASPEVNLMAGDHINVCSTAVTYDAYGNVASETMSNIATNVTVITRISDTQFTVSVPITSLAGAAYIVSNSAANWYWDDNGRKGDFVALQWLYDYRTNGEYNRLEPLSPSTGGYGVQDCAEIQNFYYWQANGTPGYPNPPSNAIGPPSGTSLALNNYFQNTGGLAAACTGANYLTWDGSNFSAQGAIQFIPCCPSIIAITPNGETWKNAVVIPFPATFTFDDRYGARWQAEIEQAMTDLLWQAPHTPCGSSLGWAMDDGTCQQPTDTTQYYAHAPLVEARINLPGNGGNNQNETAPTLPIGITIGYVSPVNNHSGLQPPGMIGWNTSTGNPVAGWTAWGYRLAIEDSACAPASCQFNYVDAENLSCVTSYTPPAPASPSLSGLGGLT